MNWLQDFRHAGRSLIKAPGFAAIVVITLGLAIGANTAILSVVDGVLLRPLPYDDPGAIVVIQENGPESEEGLGGVASQQLFLNWRQRGRSLEQIAMYSSQQATMTGGEEPVRLTGVATSATLFPLLRVDAELGRTFGLDEEEPGQDGVILLSYRTWQRYFGGAGTGGEGGTEVVGTSVTLDGQPRTVVGVMPAGFRFPDDGVEYWVPLLNRVPESDDPFEQVASQGTSVRREIREERQAGPGAADPEGPGGGGGARGVPGPGGPEVHEIELWGSVVGRLAAGVSTALAAEEGTALARGLNEGEEDLQARSVDVESLQDELVGPVRRSLLLLMGAVGFVLLIACANVANLVMARATERRKEIAVRAALGAGSSRLARLLFSESLLTAGLGAVVGLGLAYGGLRMLGVLAPGFIPRIEGVAIDARVLQFTVLLTVSTAILFSVLPARSARRLDLSGALKDDGGGLGAGVHAGSGLFRRVLVVAEVALSVVLLVGAGLLVSSFVHLTRVDPGYDTGNLLHVQLQLPASAYPDGPAHLDFYDRLVDRLEAIPGVESAAVTNQPPSIPANIRVSIRESDGPEPPPDEQPTAVGVRMVENGYFDTLRGHVLEGRTFTPDDRPETNTVAVLSRSGAESIYGERNPIGERLAFIGGQQLEIIGLVDDVRTAGVDPSPQPDIFMPYRQAPGPMVPMLFRTAHVLVRTGPAPLTVLPALRAQLRLLDSSIPVLSVATMRDRLAESVAEPRFYAGLVAAFAVLALLLAAVGIYGLLSYTVQQGVRDTAIRRALGARPGKILGGVVSHGLTLAAIGLLLGMALAMGLTRLLESMLFEIEATDPATLAIVVCLFVATALAAVLMPALRAMRIDPMDVLRGS